jgi:hypothetical protein
MYLVHVLTIHKCTLDSGLVRRCRAVARLQLSTTLVLTPRVKVAVFVTLSIVTYALVTFHNDRVCTVQ